MMHGRGKSDPVIGAVKPANKAAPTAAEVDFASDKGERVSSETECASVILAKLHSQSSQPSSFGNFLLSVEDPAKSLAYAKTHRGCGVRSREIRVECNSFADNRALRPKTASATAS